MNTMLNLDSTKLSGCVWAKLAELQARRGSVEVARNSRRWAFIARKNLTHLKALLDKTVCVYVECKRRDNMGYSLFIHTKFQFSMSK